MKFNLNALVENNTWTIMPMLINFKVIGSKWVNKVKMRVDVSIKRYKAKIIAKGYT